MPEVVANVIQFLQDSIIPILISIPLSFLIFLLMHKYKHRVLVNLGDHKWVIK